jgi:hypothetical protein
VVPAAYGDLIAAVLTLLALAALHSAVGIPLVWVFNLWRSADLLYAFYQGNASGLVPGMLQSHVLHSEFHCGRGLSGTFTNSE